MPNSILWCLKNLRFFEQEPEASKKVMVWGVIHKSLTGSFFFAEPAVDGENYKRMLLYYASSKIFELPELPIFQQNGALLRFAFEVNVFRYKTSAALDLEGRSHSSPGRATVLDFFIFLYVRLCKKMNFFCSDTTSLSYEKRD